jgi:hypothetical protein
MESTGMSDMKQQLKRVVSSRKGIGIGRCLETDLFIEGGEPDQEAIRSAIREWLVPLLVKEFLSEQETARTPIPVLEQEPTIEPVDRKERG